MKALTQRAVGLTAALLVASGVNAQPQTGESGDVVIPGGQRFIRAVVAMGAPNTDIEGGAPFMVLLARQLSAPLVVDLSRRLRDQVEELRELQRLIANLDTEFGKLTPSLAERGSTAYAKATRLLDFLGFSIVDNGERLQLQRRASNRATRRRRLLEQLGISVPLQSRLWAAGEPMLFDISDERVPLMFGADAWTEQVFEKPLDGEALFDAFVEDDAARRVLAGYAALDRPTRDFLFREVGLAPLHRNRRMATGFAQTAPYLRAINDELVFPGSDRAAWEAILDPWSDTIELISALITRNDGRAAHLWRALSLVPTPLARYLLTMNHTSAEERGRWARSLYREISTPSFGRLIRWPGDVAELFVNLRLTDDGSGIDWPGGAAAWLAALSGNDPLVREGKLDELLRDFAATASSGPGVDTRVLIGLLDKSDPDRGEPLGIRKFIAVCAALRYQPESSLPRAVPLLFRNYERFGRAYGFFVTPTPLPADTAEMLIRNLHQVDGIERAEARIDAIRQFQATMMLMHRVMLNDLLTDNDREALLGSFLNLPLRSGGGRNTVATESYGTTLTEWWRAELIPALGRGLVANGWPGDPGDTRAVLVTGLIGRIDMSPIEVDGIAYSFAPASTLGERMYIHLLTQEQPSLVNLFRLDEIAQSLQTGTADESFADEIKSKVAALETQMPPKIGDEEINAALPIAISRAELFERADTLVAELRADSAGTATIEAFRAAVSSYMGEALIGIAYALHMGDPTSFTYEQGHVAWLHRFEIDDLPEGVPELLFGPWAATAESWIVDAGSRLHNSLFGAPATLSRWNLENSMAGGFARDPDAAEAWAATLAYIHIPSLTAEAQSVIAQRHDLASSWIEAAVDARDPELVPASWVAADPSQEPPALATTLRRLMHPNDIQRFEDAVSEGRRDAALRMVTPGNRYLLLRLFDKNDVTAPPAARWLIDQTVGMPVLRRGDYLGLRTPATVPHGEAGDKLRDALLYTRLVDVRVQLSVVMEREGLPAALHARLLAKAMARVLTTMRPGAGDTWRNLLAAINAEITETAIRQWIVDLAFADELTPTDPALAMEPADITTGPAGDLVLPVDVSPYEAAFVAETNMVTVDVGVWDDDDNFVADLTIEDFAIKRAGVPVTPAYVRLEESRLRYVIGFVMEQDVDPDAEPEWIDLKVEVNRNNVEVRARPGFYWPRR